MSTFDPIAFDIRFELRLTDLERLVGLRGLANLHRVVLARRMPFPVLGHQQTTEVGVTVEDDAEHIPRLALEPPCASPHALDSRYGSVNTGTHLQSESHPIWDRQQVIHDLEARLARQVVRCSDLDQDVESHRWRVA